MRKISIEKFRARHFFVSFVDLIHKDILGVSMYFDSFVCFIEVHKHKCIYMIYFQYIACFLDFHQCQSTGPVGSTEEDAVPVGSTAEGAVPLGS